MLLIFFNRCAQLFRTFLLQTNSQLYNDFTRLNQTPWRNNWISLFVEINAPTFSKTAIAVTPINFIMQVASNEWNRYSIMSCQRATRIQYLNPLQYFTKIAVMRPCI